MGDKTYLVGIKYTDGTEAFDIFESPYYANEHYKYLCEDKNKIRLVYLCEVLKEKRKE